MAVDIMQEVTKPKKALENVLFGLAVVFLYSLIAGFVPAIMTIPVIGYTVGQAVSAGLAAIIAKYVFDAYYP